MAEFSIPNPNKYVNADLLLKETGAFIFRREDNWFISGVDTLEQALDLLTNHNPTPPTEPSIEQKLQSVGLNLNDLKEALGIA